MTHQHYYTAGAIRGKQTFRYCTVEGCNKLLFFYGTNKKPEERKDSEAAFYLELARKYNVE